MDGCSLPSVNAWMWFHHPAVRKRKLHGDKKSYMNWRCVEEGRQEQKVRMCIEGEEVSIGRSLSHTPVPVHRGNLHYVNVGKQVLLQNTQRLMNSIAGLLTLTLTLQQFSGFHDLRTTFTEKNQKFSGQKDLNERVQMMSDVGVCVSFIHFNTVLFLHFPTKAPFHPLYS